MVCRPEYQIAVAQQWKQLRQSAVPVFKRAGVAVRQATVAEFAVEINKVGED